MKIEKNKLVNRAQVLNQDIQLGIIAYSVAEMASIIEQTNAKLSSGEVTEEQHKAIIDDCTCAFTYSPHGEPALIMDEWC